MWRSKRSIHLTCKKPSLPSVPGNGLDAAVVALENVDERDSAFLQSKDGDLTWVVADESISEKQCEVTFNDFGQNLRCLKWIYTSEIQVLRNFELNFHFKTTQGVRQFPFLSLDIRERKKRLGTWSQVSRFLIYRKY